MPIFNLVADAENCVKWTSETGQFEKKWTQRLSSVVLLRDRSAFMVVESIKESGPRNLVILNADGTERCRPKAPTDAGRTYGFAYAGYEADRLVVVIATVGQDLACDIDPLTATFGPCTPRM